MKKAFTLAELLVVVLVLGVLATVATPKMKKVLKTRKTTEAENMLTALRTEQEKRCTMGKDYLTDKNQLPVLAQADQSKNYTYQLTSMGAKAVSKTGGYTIEMLSYRDGALCCDDCDGLNKDYPKCPPPPTDDECANPIPCSAGGGTKSCGCAGKGTLTATCDGNTGTWNYGACSIADECTCSDTPKPTLTTRPCGSGGCGTQTATITCNQTTDTWDVTWSECTKPTLQTEACGCENKGTRTQVCNAGQLEWGECSVSEECEVSCETPAFNLIAGGYNWTNDGMCCENGKLMDYCSGATYCDSDSWTTTPIEASAEFQETYCCDELYTYCGVCYLNEDPATGQEYCSYQYEWKLIQDCSGKNKKGSISCGKPNGGSDGGGGGNSGDIPTCKRPGTYTAETTHGNSCGMTEANSCADFHSEIPEKNCTCTVNWVEEIGDRSMNGPTCNYKVNYTLS